MKAQQLVKGFGRALSRSTIVSSAATTKAFGSHAHPWDYEWNPPENGMDTKISFLRTPYEGYELTKDPQFAKHLPELKTKVLDYFKSELGLTVKEDTKFSELVDTEINNYEVGRLVMDCEVFLGMRLESAECTSGSFAVKTVGEMIKLFEPFWIEAREGDKLWTHLRYREHNRKTPPLPKASEMWLPYQKWPKIEPIKW
eukprot:CAMPEP_0114985886 /NCGR_PEP_ID=MMETSP0216-20121206/8126_1 /TAXON_ID=223996 /ORGANISM="Protocruzia adherens, Strain Boccale" /LENGTH=198 /DNA_ID=CAMNT_0002348273 /DNA_START=31 /DNA_END=627 /DNA_ORIENTATION=+